MSIRFKFRSSVNYDALEIGERASIGIGELRAMILKGKTAQQQHQPFDLVFSDADSGLEFKGDDCSIPSGSSVIVRRVPAGTMAPAVSPVQAVKDVEIKGSHDLNPGSEPVDTFDGSGAELCLMPDSTFTGFNLEFDENDFLGNGMDQVAGVSRAECQKQGISNISHERPRGCNLSGNERIAVVRVDQQIKPINGPHSSSLQAIQCSKLPVEMKCPLCNSFFKEAVMIPCCQHSFCQNCIRQVLIEKGKCAKCFSRKCRVEDLLPNFSLRQAIEHFLEAEMLDAGLEHALQNYVPDGESGIEARDFSCAPSVVQKELELPQSSSATGKGSNQVYKEAFFEQQCQRNVPVCASGIREVKSAVPSQKVNQIDDMSGYYCHDGMRSEPEDFVPSADFQGENQPVIPLTNVHDEADYNTRRRGGHWIGSGGGERNFIGPSGHRKGVRNCYTCGSPDHLMRDCPMSHPNPMFQPGNGAYHGGMPGYVQPPYWNSSSMPPFSPYANMYGNPGMMYFNTSMVPVSPFAAPPYFPSMSASMAGSGANMRMCNMGPPRHSDHFGLQPCENKRKHPNEELERGIISEMEDESPTRYRHVNPERSHDHGPQKEDKLGLTRSDDSFARWSAGKYQHGKFPHEKVSRPSNSSRDKGPFHGERSNSGKEEPSRSSEVRHRHHHHRESRRHHERKGNCESESSHSHHSAQKDAKRGSHHSPSAFRRREYRDLDVGRDYSRHGRKHSREESREDRWRTGNGLYGDEYRHHKRRAH
ncbi:DWNN domain- a CCHC-type zinc finger [Striga hermonthica]|uniref:DWNN domain- a CCHC-type zinc finger n=1 Tax=Striga hermonthica TaxID=68872 RepID=A0A9N7P246_STRHE|nr:DWNN domain- a CCHC-type zinc finger [Striga hermonthica]